MSRGAVFFVGVAATGASLLCAAWLGLTAAPASSVVIAIAVACLPYALVVAMEPPLASPVATRWALAAAALVGLALVSTSPILSDDVYRYLWEGKLWANGFSPYHYAPDHPALFHLRDAQWGLINNRELATIYPPVAQALFFVVAATGTGIWGFKLFALLAHLITTVIVSRVAGPHGARAAFAFALNPLALTESAMNGHIDVVAGLLLLASAWALVRKLDLRGSFLAAAAIGVKLIGFAFVPLFRRGPLWVVLCVGAAMLAPLLWVAPDVGKSGTEQYAVRWKGNEGGFRIVEAGVRHVVEQTEIADPHIVTALVSRALVVALVLSLGWFLTHRRTDPLITARWVLLAGLLLAPQVHPWYLLWLIPIEIALGRYAVLVWSATVLVAYAPIDRWLADGEWIEHSGAIAFEYSAVVFALLIEHFSLKNRHRRGLL